MKKFWLIQRGSFRDLNSATKFLGRSSEHLIDPDYMGAAEFEWGAIPRAYRRIMGQYEKYSLHVTDLVTTGGVPSCLFCMDSKYEQILTEIKSYLDKPYHLKEWTNMEAHFTKSVSDIETRFYSHKLRTNFWWCIDKSRKDEDIGDWIAFTGAADRQNAFMRVINSDYTNWWLKKSEKEREDEFMESLTHY